MTRPGQEWLTPIEEVAMTISGTNEPGATRAAPDPAAMEARRAEARAQSEAIRAEFQHEIGIAYGVEPRQVLDLYLPHEAPSGPVVVFLHGGGFRGGDPGVVGHYGRPYLERGGIYVAMGYRLVPDARYPASCDDVELGLRWLVDNIARYGGDPTQIYLTGHSAGAMLAASVGLRPSAQIPADLIAGLVLISGQYDFGLQSPETVDAAAERYVANLLEAIEQVPEHTIVVAGDRDFPACLPDAIAMTSAIQAKGGSAEMFVEPDADHFQANRSFITPGGIVSEAAMKMMRL
jgi:acetyl esterase/lipase